MRLFRKRATAENAADARDFAGELRSAAERLTGWTVTGSIGVSLKTLLRESAAEIERLAAVEEPTHD